MIIMAGPIGFTGIPNTYLDGADPRMVSMLVLPSFLIILRDCQNVSSKYFSLTKYPKWKYPGLRSEAAGFRLHV